MSTVLQNTIPYKPLGPKAGLPGVQPLPPEDWLLIDEAYAGQMQVRLNLLAQKHEAVLRLDAKAVEAAQEALEFALDTLQKNYPDLFQRRKDRVLCPDGREVEIRPEDPLGTLAQIVQSDLCILQKQGDEHVLTGAILCFPASWTLDQKFLRPLGRIHAPVPEYDDNIARRVQRLFDGVRPGRPLWRHNTLWYADAELHQPRREGEKRPYATPDTAPFLRSERQTILKLPQTGATLFSIHTFLLARADVDRL